MNPDDANLPAVAGGAKKPVRFSAEVARRVCARVAAGETQVAICADPDMPSRSTLFRWARDLPRFARSFEKARTVGGMLARNGRPSTYCAATATEIFARMCEGEMVTDICRDPAMPCFSTVYYWRRNNAEFAQMMRVAREVQAERLCDDGMAIAHAVTPETARAVRERLAQLRWTASVLAPRQFRTKQVEPEDVAPRVKRALYRHFEIEVDKETGKRRVVTWWPDPDTGEVHRETLECLPPRNLDTYAVP